MWDWKQILERRKDYFPVTPECNTVYVPDISYSLDKDIKFQS